MGKEHFKNHFVQGVPIDTEMYKPIYTTLSMSITGIS